MTNKKPDKCKLIQAQIRHQRRIDVAKAFPGIEKITIEYAVSYTPFTGKLCEERNKKILTPDNHSADLFIACLNFDCTSIGFDLNPIIQKAVLGKKIETSGRLFCDGDEAYDHEGYTCEGTLDYTIKIEYK